MYDCSTELRLEAAKTTWLGALDCWVVSQHMHWRLFPRGLSHPYDGGIHMRGWTEKNWEGAAASKTEVLAHLASERLTWLTDLLETDDVTVRESVTLNAAKSVAGGAWLQAARAKRLGPPRQLRNGSVRPEGRGWIPMSLIGKAVRIETASADPAQGSEVLSLVVEHAISPHGVGNGALWCTGGQLRGRALYGWGGGLEGTSLGGACVVRLTGQEELAVADILVSHREAWTLESDEDNNIPFDEIQLSTA